MNYRRLDLALQKYGRDNGFAYVCDSYKPQLRGDKKYRQWRRLTIRVSLKAMTPNERRVLQSMLTVRMLGAAVRANPNSYELQV